MTWYLYHVIHPFGYKELNLDIEKELLEGGGGGEVCGGVGRLNVGGED